MKLSVNASAACCKLVLRTRRILRVQYTCVHQKEGRGKIGLVYWTGFCVRCRNVGSTNHIVVSGNQHKQHLNITCTKFTLVVFNGRSSKSTTIVPAQPRLLLTRLYIWQYPEPQVNYVIVHYDQSKN